jgi:hypothetical protein
LAGLHAEELSKKYPVGLDPQECFVIVEKTFEEVAL